MWRVDKHITSILVREAVFLGESASDHESIVVAKRRRWVNLFSRLFSKLEPDYH